MAAVGLAIGIGIEMGKRLDSDSDSDPDPGVLQMLRRKKSTCLRGVSRASRQVFTGLLAVTQRKTSFPISR